MMDLNQGYCGVCRHSLGVGSCPAFNPLLIFFDIFSTLLIEKTLDSAYEPPCQVPLAPRQIFQKSALPL